MFSFILFLKLDPFWKHVPFDGRTNERTLARWAPSVRKKVRPSAGKKFESVENKLFKKHFKVFLKENSIKKWKWNFFSANPKSNLDFIWHQDNYWKPSPRSTLQGSKLDLVIFDGMDEFFSKIWDTCQIFSNTWISHFFIYNQNFAFRSKTSLW